MTERDPYQTLGVPSHADHRVIRTAFRALARQFHPDQSSNPAHKARMVEVNAAWEILRDPTKRAAYDRARVRIVRQTKDGGEVVWSLEPDGTGHGGPPPGRPSGSILPFGRYIAWSLGEVARNDVGYLVWLEERREGRPFREEIEKLLRAAGLRKDSQSPEEQPTRRRW